MGAAGAHVHRPHGPFPFVNGRPVGDMPGSPFSLWSLKGHWIWEMASFLPLPVSPLPGSPLACPDSLCLRSLGRSCSGLGCGPPALTGEVLGVGDSKASCMRN